MNKIVILGMGGHARSLVDILEREGKYEIEGYVVNDMEKGNIIAGYPIIGRDNNLEEIFQAGIKYAAIGIGFLGKGSIRKVLWKKLKEIGFLLPVICDTSAIIANNVMIGEGSVIGKGAIINSGSVIGKLSIINTGAIIEHDCVIGDFTHISVGSVLCGGVRVGKETFIGANATVIQGKNIGEGCVIGAGLVIRKDMEEYCMKREDSLVKVCEGGGIK